MFSIKNVTKNYGRLRVLDDLSLDLPNKGLVALVGENGCGKTTLLNLLSTIDYQYSGTINYSGIDYRDENYHYIRNNIISYIQQENRFIPEQTVFDNVKINGIDDILAEEWLSEYGIAEKACSRPDELSGGQRQKTSFIRGILKESRVLLVDEPTSNMDKDSERKTFQLLRKIANEKLVVMVSHNMNLIEEYANLIVMMGQGKITSLIENNNETNIRFENNTVFVSDNTETAFLHEWIKIKKFLLEKKEITVRSFTKDKSNEKTLDYSIEKQERTLKQLDSVQVCRSAVSNLRYKLGSNLFSYVLGSLLLLLIVIGFFLGKVDETRFELDTFKTFGCSMIHFENNYTASERTDYQRDIHYRDFLELVEMFGPVATLSVGGFRISFPYEDDGLFLSSINGFTYFPEGFKFELLCGNYPEDKQILITDYTADYLILQTEAEDYLDIISKGFCIADYNFDVSGIIKTDYKALINSKTDYEAAEWFQKWNYYQENVYSHFFIKASLLDWSTLDNIPFVVAEYGQYIIDIEFPDDEGKYDKADQNLAEKLKFETDSSWDVPYAEIKSNLGYYIVDGTTAERETNPTLYLNPRQKNNSQYAYAFLQSEDSIQLYSLQREPYEYLSQYRIIHATPVSEAIIRTEEVTWILNEYLVPFTVIMLIIALGTGIFLWIKQEEKNKITIYLFRMTGYSDKQIAIWYLVKYAAMMIFELLGTAILFLGSGILLNQILSKIAGCKIALMRFDIGKLLIAFGIYAIFMFGFVFLYFLRNVRKAPIKLYGER